MTNAFIIFWDEEEKPLRLTKNEYEQIMQVWKTAEHIVIQGHVIHKKTIKRIKPPEKPEPLGLLESQGKPLSKDFLEEMKKKIAKKFTFKSSIS